MTQTFIFFSSEEHSNYPSLELTVQVFGDPLVSRGKLEMFLDEAQPRLISSYEFKKLVQKPPGKHYEDESHLVCCLQLCVFVYSHSEHFSIFRLSKSCLLTTLI